MKKTRFVALVLLFSLFCAGLAQTASADSWSWTNGVVRSNVLASPGLNNIQQSCSGMSSILPIATVSPAEPVCMTQKTPTAEVGTYQNGIASAIHFGHDQVAHPIVNCQPWWCLYDPAQDLFVTTQVVDNPARQSLVLFRHAAQRLLPQQNGSYAVDFSHPDEVIWGSSGRALSVHSIGLSMDGRWLAVEFYGNGFGVLDLRTMAMRKISNDSFPYDVGRDPGIGLAVSNNGKIVAVSGTNAADFIITIEPGCGFDPTVAESAAGATMCPEENIDGPLRAVQNGFLQAGRPVLNEDGSQLTIASQYWPSDIRTVTFRAMGATAHSIDFLGMGDSYSSGEGETDDAHYLNGTNEPTEKCHTSDRSYPFLVATLSHAQNVHNVACAGAMIDDIQASPSRYRGQGDRLDGLSSDQLADRQARALLNLTPGEIPQASFVDQYQPDKILLGIGGNDAGLMAKMLDCLMPDECEWIGEQGKAQTKQEVDALGPRLVSLYEDVRRRSPGSHLYAVGYPQVIDSDGACDTLTDVLFDANEQHFTQEMIHYIDQVVAAAAYQAGVNYIDIENVFAGHELCDRGQLAVNEFQVGDDVAPIAALGGVVMIGDESFHPTPYGHQLVAASVFRQIQSPGESHATTVTPPQDWAGLTAGLPAISQHIANDSVDISSRQLTVTFYPNTLRPGSVTRIEVHSAPTLLGTPVVAADGSLTVSVSLPSGLSPGYHTLHVYGTSYGGQESDYYQTIFISQKRQKDEITTPSLLTGTEAPRPYAANGPSATVGSAHEGVKGAASQHVLSKDTLVGHPPARMIVPIVGLVVCMMLTIIFALLIIKNRRDRGG